MKRGILIIIMLIIALILIILVLFTLFKKEVLLAPSQTAQVQVQVRNSPPTITNIQPIPNVNLNPSPATTNVIFTFTARDSKANDLNNIAATADFTNPGEPARMGSCSFLSEAGKERTYQCTVQMNYYDKSGAWTATVGIADLGGLTAQSSSTFTINLLRDISINSAIIDFPAVNAGDANTTSTNPTAITNNGNFEAPPGSIIITAFDLIGETNSSEAIPAANFKTADLSAQATVCTLGDTLTNSAQVAITSAILPRGPSGSNTGNIVYCLTSVPDISSQYYSAIGGNSWIIAIN